MLNPELQGKEVIMEEAEAEVGVALAAVMEVIGLKDALSAVKRVILLANVPVEVQNLLV